MLNIFSKKAKSTKKLDSKMFDFVLKAPLESSKYLKNVTKCNKPVENQMGYPFTAYPKYSERLTLLTPW